MYTVHDREQIVRVFEPDGTLFGTFGGKGEGPGEFQGIGPIGWVGDSLWVLDRPSYRFTFFSKDGGFLSSFLVPFEFQMGPDDPFPPHPSGLLSDGTIYGTLSVGARDVAEGKATHRHIVLLSRKGEITNLVDSIPYGRNTWQVSDPDHPRGMMMYPPQPFGDGSLWGIHPNEPALSILEREAPNGIEDAVFRLVKLSVQGDTVFARTHPYAPIPISSAEIDSTLNANVRQWVEWGVMGGAPAGRLRMWAEQEFYTPSFSPPITNMVIGRDGGYWLRGFPVEEGTVEWYSFDSSGIPLGRVRFPVGFTMLAGEAETVWGTESDEFDVPYLVRFRVHRNGS